MVATPSTSAPVCQIGTVDGIVRGIVRGGSAAEIQKCYADWALACLLGQFRRALLVGVGHGDAFSHLAARDAIAAMALAGVPAGFRVAVVALDAHLIAVYDTAVVEAGRRGIEARRFADEAQAVKWLGTP